MKLDLTGYVAEVKKVNMKKKRWQRVLSVLIAIVVFCTTYALILPAITMDMQVVCGFEEHTHGVECYSTETHYVCEVSCVHTHNDECYESADKLICESLAVKSLLS